MFSADQIWNNLLKEIARQAFKAGEEKGTDDEAYASRGCGPHVNPKPDFEEWWETFVEQNHADG